MGKSDGQPSWIIWAIRRCLSQKLRVHLLQEFVNVFALNREASHFFNILNKNAKKNVKTQINNSKPCTFPIFCTEKQRQLRSNHRDWTSKSSKLNLFCQKYKQINVRWQDIEFQ